MLTNQVRTWYYEPTEANIRKAAEGVTPVVKWYEVGQNELMDEKGEYIRFAGIDNVESDEVE